VADVAVTRTIRFRITALAVLLSGGLLIGVSLLMTAVLRWQLTENLDEGLNQRADTIASVIADTVPPRLSADEDLLVQVVGADGSVVAASDNLAGAVPITGLRPGVRTLANVSGRVEEFRVVVRRIDSGDGPVTLIVAVNNDDVSDPVAVLSWLLVAAVPAMVVLLGVLTWWLAGRTLRPVEKMRVEIADITGTDLGRRVAPPGSGDEIDRLAHTMNATLDRLDGALRRQRRFVADASHELRGPLTRIRSELEIDLAQGKPVDPATTERSVLDETVSLQHLVEDLLQLARSDEGLTAMDWQPVDLDDIVLREARRLRERGRIAVDLLEVSAAQTYGDSAQLTRAVRNLLDNAERHASTIVTVSLAEREARVQLTVADDGIGIPPDDRPSIFERFTRLDEARSRDAGGTGLGLAIVRDIVVRHGGSIHLDDGRATKFVIDLPLAP
jgi:signal transduction histidine kinase